MNKNMFMQVFEISKMGMNLSLNVGSVSSGFIPKLFQHIIFTSIVFIPKHHFCAKTNIENIKEPFRAHKPSDFNLINELERK